MTLKRLREKSGLTTSQVGELLGKSGKTVNAWEHNHGHVKVMECRPLSKDKRWRLVEIVEKAK